MENEIDLVPVPVKGQVVRRDGKYHVVLTIDRKSGSFFLWCRRGTHDRKVSGHTLTLEADEVITVSRTEQFPQDTLSAMRLEEYYPVTKD